MSDQQLSLEHVRYMYIIDDDAVQREMIKDYMSERYLFTIDTFEDGESALANINTHNPEIVVLDYYLNANNKSAKDGISILKEIKAKSPETEVIMFTGEDKLEVAMESMRNGAFDYVVKGESAFNKIEKVIDTLGERHRLKAQTIAQRKAIIVLAVLLAITLLAAFMYVGTLKDFFAWRNINFVLKVVLSLFVAFQQLFYLAYFYNKPILLYKD
jgi:two-component system, OmpR family, response regulator